MVLLFSLTFVSKSNAQKQDTLGIVLRALYDNLGGDNWKHKDNWFSDKPYTEWYGLHFDVSGLYSIDLMDNNLTGTLPKEIGMLPKTVIGLDVRYNNIEGNIPVEVLNVPRMYLNIADNKFSGTLPEEIKTACFYDEEWIYREMMAQKFGYGFDLPCTVNMIKLDDNIYLHPKFNAVECRLSKEDVEKMISANGKMRKQLIKQIYNLFNDEFDFISVVFNTAHNSSIGEKGVSDGYFSDVENHIKGIGNEDPFAESEEKIYDYTKEFGSDGKLSGIMTLNRAMSAFLHEIMHNWGALYLGQVSEDNFNKTTGHWGISDVNGILGGFDSKLLTSNVDGFPNKYSYTGFSLDMGSEIYAPIELYLMGLMDIRKVPDAHVYKNIKKYEIVPDTTDPVRIKQNIIFVADEVTTWTWKDIEKVFGKRNPSYKDSQKKFTVLNLVITEKPINDVEWQIIQDNIYLRSAQEETDSPYVVGGSFWQATGGLATVEMDRLNEKLKNPIVSSERIDKDTGIKLFRDANNITITSNSLIEYLDVYDMSGRKVLHLSVNSNTATFNLNDNSHYIFRVSLGNNQFETIKI